MKLEVGMYVRTNNNGIAKIKGINNNFLLLDKIPQSVFIQNVIRASHTLLGNDKEPCLIEVGDIITYKTDIGSIRVQDVHNSVVIAMIKNKEIEVLSIVTKEQFESMSYRLEE